MTEEIRHHPKQETRSATIEQLEKNLIINDGPIHARTYKAVYFKGTSWDTFKDYLRDLAFAKKVFLEFRGRRGIWIHRVQPTSPAVVLDPSDLDNVEDTTRQAKTVVDSLAAGIRPEVVAVHSGINPEAARDIQQDVKTVQRENNMPGMDRFFDIKLLIESGKEITPGMIGDYARQWNIPINDAQQIIDNIKKQVSVVTTNVQQEETRNPW